MTIKQNKRSLICGFSVLMLLFVAYATNVFAADEVTVTGIVYATAYDDNDNVKTAIIVASDEEYVIVDNAAGKELFNLCLKVVKASGVVGEDSEWNKTLTVTSYELMPEEK